MYFMPLEQSWTQARLPTFVRDAGWQIDQQQIDWAAYLLDAICGRIVSGCYHWQAQPSRLSPQARRVHSLLHAVSGCIILGMGT